MAGPILRLPQPAEMFAADLLRCGVQYIEAFHQLTLDDENPRPHASFFLLAHGLELFLKAALCATGTEKSAAIGMGHKVDRLFSACQERGLPAVENLDNLVAHVALMNRDFDFRYPTPYRLKMPSPAACLQIMEALELAIRPSVIGAALKAELALKADERLRNRTVVWTDN